MTEARRLSPFAFSNNQGREDGDFRPTIMPMDVDMEEIEEVSGDPKDLSVQESAPSSPPTKTEEQRQTSMPDGLEDLELESSLESPETTATAARVSTPPKATASSTPPSLPGQKSGPGKPPAKV